MFPSDASSKFSIVLLLGVYLLITSSFTLNTRKAGDVQNVSAAATDTAGNAVIRGYVLGDENKDSLPGVSIFLNGTLRGITDAAGHYSIQVPDSLLKDSIIFKIGYLGFHTVKDTISPDALPLQKKIILKACASPERSIIVCTISREDWMVQRYCSND